MNKTIVKKRFKPGVEACASSPRLKQDHGIEASLGYIARPSFYTEKNEYIKGKLGLFSSKCLPAMQRVLNRVPRLCCTVRLK